MDYRTHMWTDMLFYTTVISVDLAHHDIFHAKDGKGGIKTHTVYESKNTTKVKQPALSSSLRLLPI